MKRLILTTSLFVISLCISIPTFGQDQHLGGGFYSANFTWSDQGNDLQDNDVEFKYDPGSAPPNTPAAHLEHPGTPGKNYSSLRSSSVAEVGSAHFLNL